jgi:putative Mg2+ transporter-C (MgtC) family protein
MSAALLMVLGDVIMVRIADLPSREYVSADPMRMIQAIIIGVSFLGAGTIVHAGGDQVEGLTTAASILLTCCVGIAVALHLFLTSLGVTAVAVVVLLAVGFFERRLSGGRKS